MTGFRIGFIGVLSFLLYLAISTGILAYYPAPEGPKAPIAPTYSDLSSGMFQAQTVDGSPAGVVQNLLRSSNTVVPPINVQANRTPLQAQQTLTYPTPTSDPNSYTAKLDKYNKDLKQYTEDKKDFYQKKLVPYIKKVSIIAIIAFVVFEIIAVIFIKTGNDLVGSGFAFSGIFAIVLEPVSTFFSVISLLLSAYVGDADALNLTSIYKAIMWTSIVSVIVLSFMGSYLYGKLRFRFPSRGPQTQMPPQNI